MATAFKIAEEDNVATLLDDAGAVVIELRGEGLCVNELKLHEPVELGHKVALQAIACSEAVIKYGVVIGEATQAIAPGDWVHLHNCKSRLDERSATLDLHTGMPGDTTYA